MSFDCTAALLDDTVAQVPRTPDFVDSVEQDDSEDEIFFGSVSDKEATKYNTRSKRRDTICDTERRRSYEVLKTKAKFSSLNSNGSRSSLYDKENSIAEEDEGDEDLQDPEVSSTLHSLELLSLPNNDDNKENARPSRNTNSFSPAVLANKNISSASGYTSPTTSGVEDISQAASCIKNASPDAFGNKNTSLKAYGIKDANLEAPSVKDASPVRMPASSVKNTSIEAPDNNDSFVTGRRYRQSGMSVLCSLPSASKLDQLAEKELGLSRSELKARTGDNKPKKKSQSGSQPLQAQRECSLPALEMSSSSSGGFTLDERARAILESDSSFSSQDEASVKTDLPTAENSSINVSSLMKNSLCNDSFKSCSDTLDKKNNDSLSTTEATNDSFRSSVSSLPSEGEAVEDNDSMSMKKSMSAAKSSIFRLGSDVSRVSATDSEFELGSLAEGECGADLVDGAVVVSFSEDTDMSLGEDSVFTRPSMEGADFTTSESFTLGHIHSESVSHEPTSPPTIKLTKPSETELTQPVRRETNKDISELQKFGLPQSDSALKRISRRLSVSSVESCSFETTEEEMILYDMFGEDYDVTVERMTKRERAELKEKIRSLTKEERKAIDERIRIMIEQEGGYDDDSPRCSVKLSSVGSDVSPFSLSPDTPASTNYMEQDSVQRTPTPLEIEVPGAALKKDFSYLVDDNVDKNNSYRFKPSRVSELTLDEVEDEEKAEDDNVQRQMFKPSRVSEVVLAENYEEDPGVDRLEVAPSHGYLNKIGSPGDHYPNYLQHTYASLQRASPQKHCNLQQQRSPCKRSPLKPWMPPSPSPIKTTQMSSFLPLPTQRATGKIGGELSATPSKIGGVLSATPSKIGGVLSATPSKIGGVLSATPSRIGGSSGATPKTNTPKFTPVFKTPLSSATKSRIPHIKAAACGLIQSPITEYIRNNPAPPLVQNVKAKTKDDLESTLMESASEKENSYPALPSGSYTSAKLAQDVEYDVTGKDYHLDKAFGQQSTLVKVTRHLDRAKVNIRWDEGQLVNLESVCSSPSVARCKEPTKSLLKRTQRDSGLFDESMMDISLHQTEVVRKIASGRGGGKGKGRGGRGRGRGKAKK